MRGVFVGIIALIVSNANPASGVTRGMLDSAFYASETQAYDLVQGKCTEADAPLLKKYLDSNALSDLNRIDLLLLLYDNDANKDRWFRALYRSLPRGEQWSGMLGSEAVGGSARVFAVVRILQQEYIRSSDIRALRLINTYGDHSDGYVAAVFGPTYKEIIERKNSGFLRFLCREGQRYKDVFCFMIADRIEDKAYLTRVLDAYGAKHPGDRKKVKEMKRFVDWYQP